MKIYNLDVAGVIRRLRRFRYETFKAASANLAAVSEADFSRAKSYINALTAYLDWVVAQPQLDLPESSPREIDLGEPEALPNPDNEALADLMQLYNVFEIEMANCQSARQTTGIISHDEKRVRDIIAKMEAFLDDYVAQVLPLDLPESSPNAPHSGPGKVGT